MNTELLLKVRDRILAEPEHFDMDFFFEKQPCGTTACIGGWAVVLHARQSLPRMLTQYDRGNWSCFEKARNILKIDADQSSRLFSGFEWPEIFRKEYAFANAHGKAAVAARRIDHFIATNGAE